MTVIRLTEFERQQIASFRRQGISVREIGRRLKRDHSIISRELRRNAGQFFPYDASRAQYFSKRRARKTNRYILEKDRILLDWVTDRLWEDWSPEQIAGRLKKHPPPELVGKHVSYESIYRYIYSEAPHLYHRLRKTHPRRYPKYGRKSQRVRILGRINISERPKAVSRRLEVGHWEADTLEGRRTTSDHLSVHEERLTRFTRLHRINGKLASSTLKALKQTIHSVPNNFIRSITFDNGTENAHHRQLKLPTYFCDPYKSWQKGSVENTNGLIRQYFPKKTDFTLVSDEQISFVEQCLNERPRKSLNYQTPNEMIKILSGALNS